MSLLAKLEDAVEFAENPEPRCPCVLLLDTSGSMQGAPLDAMLAGLEAFRFDLAVDPLAARRVEVAVVAFDNRIRVVQDFVSPDRFDIPFLNAEGMTHIGAAIEKALEMVEERKQRYRAYDVAYYRPWIFLVTDGEPQGEPPEAVERATQRLREAETKKQVAFFAVGVENANMEALARIAVRQPLRLKGLDFREMFVWLSRSMQSVAHSRPDETIKLAPTGWAEL
ncbi:vWA domain-containing protein [Longimicrobium sp.]|uniref:vWA domain-containing protein n=1 Tax=Longimicrobium sp. TaxID=2029185 RepID=UPI002B66AAD3|nr:VWA domain-containing protein [Longimicrobium sp.]HSU13904.1 VWA domain-containing protein [Longimicrobium sp.]